MPVSAGPYPAYRPSGVEWLGDVPEHWSLPSLQRLVRLKAGDGITSDDIGSAGTYPVFGGNGVRGYADSYTHDGDFALIGRQGALCGNVHLARGKFWASEHAVVVAPLKPTILAWLGHMLAAMKLNQYSDAAAQPGLAIDRIRSLLLPLPPLDEQRAIAAFLDRETERIDALVAKKRQLIERLREHRTALITRTVTRGLPPDAARAAGLDPSLRLKPSGVEWLGDVPEHWEVKPLRSLVSFRGGATPSKSQEDFWDGDIPWVSPKDMKRPLIADSEDHVTPAALAESPCTVLPVQSVLVVVRGMILAHSFPVATTEAPVTINQDMKALLSHESLSTSFLHCFLAGMARALVSLCDESAHGTRRLETGTLAGFPTPVPPLGEQTAIAEFLDAQTRRLDELIHRAESAIEGLQEYRTALITAAVTGKVDVRGAVADPGPVASE